jgi:hypothetical protein
VHIVFWWGNLKVGDQLEYPDADERILKWLFETWDARGHRLD